MILSDRWHGACLADALVLELLDLRVHAGDDGLRGLDLVDRDMREAFIELIWTASASERPSTCFEAIAAMPAPGLSPDRRTRRWRDGAIAQ
jgi:hypothetical protein